jgi:hypothetical protein
MPHSRSATFSVLFGIHPALPREFVLAAARDPLATPVSFPELGLDEAATATALSAAYDALHVEQCYCALMAEAGITPSDLLPYVQKHVQGIEEAAVVLRDWYLGGTALDRLHADTLQILKLHNPAALAEQVVPEALWRFWDAQKSLSTSAQMMRTAANRGASGTIGAGCSTLL